MEGLGINSQVMVQQRQQQEQQARALLYAKAVGGDHSPAPPRSDNAGGHPSFNTGQSMASPVLQGETNAMTSPPLPTLPKGDIAPSVKMRPDYEARREAFMAGRSAAASPALPAKRKTTAAQSPALPPGDADHIPAVRTRPDYEARRDAFFAGRRRSHSSQKPTSVVSPEAGNATEPDALPVEGPRRVRPIDNPLGGVNEEVSRAEFMKKMRKERKRRITGPEHEDANPSLE